MLTPRFAWTTRADGDQTIERLAADPGCTWLRQVHGASVVAVTAPGEHAGAEADAAITDRTGCRLVVRTADCVPVVLLGARSVGVAHAGWRGAVAGVVDATVSAMRSLGDPPTAAHLGPCIRPGCYEFDSPDRATVVDRFGTAVEGMTTWGTPALDLPAAVCIALREAGVAEIHDVAGCTACDRRGYSHRARGEHERFATVAWLEAP